MTKVQNAPLKYHGGKSYLAKWLHSLAPPSVNDDPENGYTHRNIVFAGGLGEFWNWECEGISEAVNDLNRGLYNFWSVLRDETAFAEFARLCSATPFSDEIWCNADFNVNQEVRFMNAEQAHLFFVCYRQSRQGLGKDYATPTRRTRRGMNENVSAWLSAVDGLPEAHERLRRVEIRNMDCCNFVRTYDHAKALFYLDPPYLHETRHGKGKNSEYQHEMSFEDHGRLLDCLGDIQGQFMLSGYRNGLYDDTAKVLGWKRHEKQIDNKASGAKSKEMKTECVWTNY